MVTMNIPLDEALAKELEELAKRTGKPVQQFMADAARVHLDYTRRLLADIEQGRREIADGRFVTSDDVRAELARRRQERDR
jgi:predicted transcriptional regulator